jgi:hypothetical protein
MGRLCHAFAEIAWQTASPHLQPKQLGSLTPFFAGGRIGNRTARLDLAATLAVTRKTPVA